jgi:hypothetical protein
VAQRIVISQPMVFPWVGLFEQVRLADAFVHYDDVQLPQGRSFMSRVQIKSAEGVRWLTIPVKRGLQLIRDAEVDDSQRWRERHLGTLRQCYAKAPYLADMLEIVERTYALATRSLSEINCFATEATAAYFQLAPRFLRSSALAAPAASSEKLLNIVIALGGTTYVTGHGARNYLDHELFERHGICVEYMDYRKLRYPQLHGDFTPYVSILDLIANAGRSGAQVICSGTVGWREFVARSAA